MQSPGPAPRPSAAAALSPAPGPSTAPLDVRPATSCGPSTVGTAGRRPRIASSSRSKLVAIGLAGEIPGSAGVAAVGAQVADVGRSAQPPGQPVVWQTHRGRRIGMSGFLVGEPAQLGDRDGGDGHHTDTLRPLLGAIQLRNKLKSGGTGSSVVPQQCISHHIARLVQAHHPVLLCPTDTASTSSSPPAALMAACRAAHHDCGSTSVPSGCGDDADRTVAPVSASQITTLQDWVDESMPATRATCNSLVRPTMTATPPQCLYR